MCISALLNHRCIRSRQVPLVHRLVASPSKEGADDPPQTWKPDLMKIKLDRIFRTSRLPSFLPSFPPSVWQQAIPLAESNRLPLIIAVSSFSFGVPCFAPSPQLGISLFYSRQRSHAASPTATPSIQIFIRLELW